LVLAVLGACGPGPGGSANAGTPGEGVRIVALSPAVAVMLRDLGLADRVVGRHDYDLILPEHVPKVGHQEAVDYERLLSTRPTHVLIEWGQRPLPPRLTDLAASNGWEVVAIRLLTLDDIAHTLDDLALRFGVVDFGPGASGRPPGVPPAGGLGALPRFTDPAERFGAELPSARLARAWSPRDGGLGSVGRVLLLGATDPFGALGPGSFHHEILLRIGGVPAITEGSPWMELDAEDVLRLAPDAIVLIAPRGVDAEAGAAGPGEVLARLGRVGTLDIPAVRAGRLGLIDDPLSLTPSTAMAGFADELAGLLSGWKDSGRDGP